MTATGLKLQFFSDIELSLDGAPIRIANALHYKGMMYSDIPNLASVFGYTNASWTLKADLTAQYVCRLLNYMDRRGFDVCTPRRGTTEMEEEPMLSFTSGYVQRAMDQFPRQGSKAPWRLHQNYALDLASLRLRPVDDGTMEFARRKPARRAA